MKLNAYWLTVWLIVFNFAACSITRAQKLQIFTESGQDWVSQGTASWKFVKGELVGLSEAAPGGGVMTRETYRNFILELEFYPDSTVNSGIFVRCKEAKLSNISCYEMNIWDLHPDQNSRTGSIVTRAAPLSKVTTLNRWNTYKIRCEGNSLKTWINGKQMTDIVDNDLEEGYIALQAAEYGRVKFRNVRLQILQ